jgi:hypothetical protein
MGRAVFADRNPQADLSITDGMCSARTLTLALRFSTTSLQESAPLSGRRFLPATAMIADKITSELTARKLANECEPVGR